MDRGPQRHADAADVIVIGSGFGGAVSALRLAEQGLTVLVLEQGRRHSPDDLLAARRDPRRYLWMPGLGLRGFFWQRVLRHVGIIGGAGVGRRQHRVGRGVARAEGRVLHRPRLARVRRRLAR
ncbi:FAD-binding protein [Dietzia cercidiphylli]|nr:FAD-binding protein [Dietzia cercidiphylli]